MTQELTFIEMAWDEACVILLLWLYLVNQLGDVAPLRVCISYAYFLTLLSLSSRFEAAKGSLVCASILPIHLVLDSSIRVIWMLNLVRDRAFPLGLRWHLSNAFELSMLDWTICSILLLAE